MMITKFKLEGYDCHCVAAQGVKTLAFLIYPALAELNDKWLSRMAEIYNVGVVAIYVPADQWNNALTPWAAPPEAKGFDPFGGNAPEFLKFLQSEIIPRAIDALHLDRGIDKDLIGVSLAGLFTLWQWMLCDTFRNIASLSGSFWYEGFLDWFEKLNIPAKTGKAFFLLGEEEPKAHIEAYRSVGINTEKIVSDLKKVGIDIAFEWVPGNHFSRPVHRAEQAFLNLYGGS